MGKNNLIIIIRTRKIYKIAQIIKELKLLVMP
jgi:hypothetical protein